MPEPESGPDVNAETALELVRAENEYRSTMVGPVPPDALPLLKADYPEDAEAGQAVLRDPVAEPDP